MKPVKTQAFKRLARLIPLWIRANFRVKAALFVLAALLWLLVETAKVYEVGIPVPVRVVGLRPGKMIVSEVPDFADVKFQATGRELFRMLYLHKPYLKLDLSTINNYYTFHLKPEMVIVPGGLSALPIDVISPDTVMIVIKDHEEVMLPVLPRVKVVPEPGWTVAGKIDAVPSTVRATLPRGVAERLKGVYTEPVEMVGVKRATELDLALVPPPGTAAVLQPDRVKVLVRVERLTERTLRRLTVRVENAPGDREVFVEPAQVDVHIAGAPSVINKLTEDETVPYVDFREFAPAQGGKVSVHVQLPESLHVISVDPPQVRVVVRRR